MQEDRLPAELWIKANIRKCQVRNMPVYIVQKGDPHTGTVLLKILDRDFQCRLFSQMRDMDGTLKWFDRLGGETLPESEAGAMAQSLAKNDPDLWVVEIETTDGQNPFDGEMISP